MIRAIKDLLKRHWPKLRLRTILLGVLLFVAGLPGVGAIFLRVYENTLVRQTEAELVAQGSTLVAVAGGELPSAPKAPAYDRRSTSWNGDYDEAVANSYYRPEPPALDLSRQDVLPERPKPMPITAPPTAEAVAMANRLAPVIARTQRTMLASIIMVDAQGIILNGADKGQSYGHLPEVQRALKGKTAMLLRRNADYRPNSAFEWLSRAAALRIHHVRPIIIDGKIEGAIILSRSSKALFKGLYQDWGKITLGILMIFATLIFLSLLLHRAIAKPIEALSLATRNVAAGNGAVPEAPPTAAIEIQALYADFAEMADAIGQRSRYLRDFAAALSHEFKTPLAGIRGAIELIEDHHGSMSDAERSRFLGNISKDADRLSALVGRLMTLARADMAQPDQGASARLEPLLAKVADALRHDRFSVDVNSGGPNLVAAIDETALESVLVTLLENAAQAGASEAQIKAAQKGRDIHITITDNGPGIAPSDRERLFEPFFTTRRAQGGTGLGLAIARALVEAHKGRLELLDAEQGARFLLVIPKV
jgi:two-component system, OmpR family, sensor histidine kinase ChvG